MEKDDWKIGGSVRAKARLNELGKPQKYLMEALGVETAGAISQFLTGKRRPNSNQLKALAEQLNCSVHWLLTGDGDIEPHHFTNADRPEISQVPLLDIEEVGDIDINSLSKVAADKNIELVSTGKDIGSRCGPNAFAVIVQDSSMSPMYQPGDYVFIDPDNNPYTGATVLATIKVQPSPIIRDFSEDDENIEGNESFTLIAREKGWGSISIDEPSKSNRIIGTVIGRQRPIQGYLDITYRLDAGD